MGLFLNFFSVLWLSMKRLWSNKALTVAIILGLIVAVALVTGVPLYSDAVSYQLMREELSQIQTEGRTRPPFAFMYRYVGAWHGAVEWEDFTPLDSYFAGQGPATIGLPLELRARHVKTDNFRLFPASEAEYADIRKPLEWVNVGFVSGLQDHIRILEGRFPQAETTSGGATEVLISQRLVEKLGLQPGEDYILFTESKETEEGGRKKRVQVPARIAGVWEPVDPQEPFWFYDPGAFEKVLFVSEESFAKNLVPKLEDEVYLAVWYLIFDGEDVHTQQAPELLGRIVTTEAQVSSLLPNTSLDISPKDALLKYRRKAQVLTILLYVFSIPIVGLVLYFIVLISGMVVQRQRNEISVLKSRGTSNLQILGIYLLEGVLVGVIALTIGPFGGRLIAQIMGNIKSFLAIVQRPPLPVTISLYSLRLGGAAMVIAILASLIPALSAARLTIVTYKQELARSLQQPFWKRYFLDVIILAAPLYGYYLLRQQGTLALGGEAGSTSNPFQNPLLFLVPTLFIFAMALVFMRFFPLLMRLLAWLGRFIGNVSSLLALRHLARSARYYIGPLLLLILTLSLAAFSASMAKTLDTSLYDQAYYRTGGDVLLVETGWDTSEGSSSAPGGGTVAAEEEEEEGPRWYFLPVADHLKVPGVEAATRVGQYSAVARLQKRDQKGQFVGVDRLDFPKVAAWRSDYAYRYLGSLMNELARDRTALLVSPSFLGANSLYMGDKVHLRIGSTLGQSQEIEFTIRGTVDYFPTLYPEDGPIFVGNLNYVFEQMGNEFPYDVWIKLAPWVNTEQVVDQLGNLQFRILDYRDARTKVVEEQAKPERRGIFGLLSVGFVAAAVLTVMGFLLYSFISFRRRFIELGVLRAIGLSVTQMAAFLAFEQFFLVAIGIVVGMALGTWTSSLFIPFLQVGAGEHAQTPPFVVLIAWNNVLIIVAVFAAMFLVAIMSMIWLLSRMRVFEAIKLGEATL
ncbi:MAG: FtsX-like permease family protein [Chloroflexota bacterium]|nr:FtsX-like permease family protein [Chloroflexota bacterium]